jgi:hypothetical protein
MNRFRKLGFISYNGRIQVHKSLLNVVLLDQLPDHNSQKPRVVFTPEKSSRQADRAPLGPIAMKQPVDRRQGRASSKLV